MVIEKTIRDIKSLRIQGAENIAKAAVSAMADVMHSSKAKKPEHLYHELACAKERLFKTRPTEPCMRNALNYVFHDIHGLSLPSLVTRVERNIAYVKSYFEESDKKIAEIGSRVIKDGDVVYTHCHSSTVIKIIERALVHDKKVFEVHNTETRPLYQGRRTAEELSKMGIRVSHYVDSAMRLAVKKADICLIGADAVQANGKVVNKIGSELLAETAKRFGVPVFVCTNSWKFDSKTAYTIDEPIEDRGREEIWPKAPKRIKIMNPAFEKVHPENITSIISELGAFTPDVFISETRLKFPWLWH